MKKKIISCVVHTHKYSLESSYSGGFMKIYERKGFVVHIHVYTVKLSSPFCA